MSKDGNAVESPFLTKLSIVLASCCNNDDLDEQSSKVLKPLIDACIIKEPLPIYDGQCTLLKFSRETISPYELPKHCYKLCIIDRYNLKDMLLYRTVDSPTSESLSPSYSYLKQISLLTNDQKKHNDTATLCIDGIDDEELYVYNLIVFLLDLLMTNKRYHQQVACRFAVLLKIITIDFVEGNISIDYSPLAISNLSKKLGGYIYQKRGASRHMYTVIKLLLCTISTFEDNESTLCIMLTPMEILRLFEQCDKDIVVPLTSTCHSAFDNHMDLPIVQYDTLIGLLRKRPVDTISQRDYKLDIIHSYNVIAQCKIHSAVSSNAVKLLSVMIIKHNRNATKTCLSQLMERIPCIVNTHRSHLPYTQGTMPIVVLKYKELPLYHYLTHNPQDLPLFKNSGCKRKRYNTNKEMSVTQIYKTNVQMNIFLSHLNEPSLHSKFYVTIDRNYNDMTIIPTKESGQDNLKTNIVDGSETVYYNSCRGVLGTREPTRSTLTELNIKEDINTALLVKCVNEILSAVRFKNITLDLFDNHQMGMVYTTISSLYYTELKSYTQN